MVQLVESIIILILLLRFFIRKYRTKANLIRSVIHITGICLVFFFIGHLASIATLYVANYKTIHIFKKYSETVPVADRINGAWILEEKEFAVTDEERNILTENYLKLSPCYYAQGYCYFELGGFLKNSGGYCIRIDENKKQDIGSLGFHRIDKLTRLIGNWMYYE